MSLELIHHARPDAIAAGHFDRQGIYWRGCDPPARWLCLRGYHRGYAVVCDRDWTLLRGGQIALGIEGLALGMLVLTGLLWFDYHMKQEQHGALCLATERDEPQQEAIRAIVQKAG